MPLPSSPFGSGILGRMGETRDVIFWDDFTTSSVSTTANEARYLATVVDTGTAGAEVHAIADDFAVGGWLQCKVNADAADITNIQANGEAFRVTAGKDIYFETKLACDDVSETNFFVGLASTDTTIYAAVNDRIGFEMDNDGNIDAVNEDDGNQTKTDTNIDLSDSTNGSNARVLAFWLKMDTKEIRFYVDGVLKATHTTNIPDTTTDLTVSLENETGGTTATSVFLDYVLCTQKR